MPSKQDRLTLTLGTPLATRLRLLAALTGRSRGAVIVDLMEGSFEQMDKFIDQYARAQDDAAERGVQNLLAEVEKILNPGDKPIPVRRSLRKQGQPTAQELLEKIQRGVKRSEANSARRRGKARGAKPMEGAG